MHFLFWTKTNLRKYWSDFCEKYICIHTCIHTYIHIHLWKYIYNSSILKHPFVISLLLLEGFLNNFFSLHKLDNTFCELWDLLVEGQRIWKTWKCEVIHYLAWKFILNLRPQISAPLVKTKVLVKLQPDIKGYWLGNGGSLLIA